MDFVEATVGRPSLPSVFIYFHTNCLMSSVACRILDTGAGIRAVLLKPVPLKTNKTLHCHSEEAQRLKNLVSRMFLSRNHLNGVFKRGGAPLYIEGWRVGKDNIKRGGEGEKNHL
jgi:hypothetical protein